MSTIDAVRSVLDDALKLGDRVDDFEAATPLLGAVPEFDSMAVVTVITALEESFGIEFEDGAELALIRRIRMSPSHAITRKFRASVIKSLYFNRLGSRLPVRAGKL